MKPRLLEKHNLKLSDSLCGDETPDIKKSSDQQVSLVGHRAESIKGQPAFEATFNYSSFRIISQWWEQDKGWYRRIMMSL